MQIVHEYYKTEKQYAFNAAASSCHRASFLQLFKDSFRPRSPSPTFIWKFLSKFFCSITLIFHQNSLFVAETQWLHQTTDTKLSSATKQRAFGYPNK